MKPWLNLVQCTETIGNAAYRLRFCRKHVVFQSFRQPHLRQLSGRCRTHIVDENDVVQNPPLDDFGRIEIQQVALREIRILPLDHYEQRPLERFRTNLSDAGSYEDIAISSGDVFKLDGRSFAVRP